DDPPRRRSSVDSGGRSRSLRQNGGRSYVRIDQSFSRRRGRARRGSRRERRRRGDPPLWRRPHARGPGRARAARSRDGASPSDDRRGPRPAGDGARDDPRSSRRARRSEPERRSRRRPGREVADVSRARRNMLAFAAGFLVAVWAGLATAQPDPGNLIIEGQGTAALSWEAPTEREDGSPLTNLAGFVIFWGDESRVGRCASDYPTAKDDASCYPASFDVMNPGATGESLVLELSETTTIYFAAIAYDSAGKL